MMGGLKVLTEDEIWKNEKKVFNELPSSKIASGFVQASSILQRKSSSRMVIIAFLVAGTQGRISTGIQRYFNEMAKRLSRKDNTKKMGAAIA
jgi:hypothetical protein